MVTSNSAVATCGAYNAVESPWVQRLCPVPKRFLQELIQRENLKTGLDIGCGVVSPFTALRKFGFTSFGADISAEEITRSQAANAHDHYVQCNFLEHDFGRQFDVVVLSHVIEHFDRDTGWQVIRKLEEIASRVVYIETPHGFIEQTAFDGNPYQRHQSGWFPADFEARGYTVLGNGLRWGAASGSKPGRGPAGLRRLISRGISWYLFRRPQSASTIAAVRHVDASGNLREV